MPTPTPAATRLAGAASALAAVLIALAFAVTPRPDLEAAFLVMLAVSVACQLVLWGALVAVTGRPITSAACWTLGSAALVVVNDLKFHYTSTVVLPVDVFAVLGIVYDFTTFVDYLGYHALEATVLATMAGLVVLAAARERSIFGSALPRGASRAAYVAAIALVAAPIGSSPSLLHGVLVAAGAEEARTNPSDSVRRSGLFAHLVVSAPGFFPDLPDAYGDAARFHEQYRRTSQASAGGRHAAPPAPAAREAERSPQPDIVVILAESFFDPRRLRLDIRPRPLATFDRLATESAASGTLRVHTVGGGTVRAEYSFLTGIPTSLLGQAGRWPFYSLVTDSTWSIAHHLRSRGYRTVAVYPVRGSLFNARAAYHALGFDEVIDLMAFDEADRAGSFVRDDAIARRIAAVVDGSDEPVFVMALTMGTHGPWSFRDSSRARRYTVAEAAAPDQIDVLEGYLHRLPDLEALVVSTREHLSKHAGPYVLALFGDHVPAMQTLFDAVGFHPGATENPRFETPYLVLAGDSPDHVPARRGRPRPEVVDGRALDIGLLAGVVLDVAGLNDDVHFGMSSAYRALCGGSFASCRGGENLRRSYVQVLYDTVDGWLSRDRWRGRVLQRSLAPDYRLGAAIEPGSLHFGAGWSAESWGAWTVARRAFVNLRVTEPLDADLMLEASVRPYRTVRAASVTVNGQVVDTWSFSGEVAEQRSTVVPLAVLDDTGRVRIRFDVDEPVSPRELGLGWDRRSLGIALSDVRLIRRDTARRVLR